MALPDGVDPRTLDQQVRQELRSLAKDTADLVARHLVVAGGLLNDDPQAALVHARAARALAGRVGSVREASGLAAYAAQEWAEALTELRAARRMTGRPEHLAVMADCERALSRPDRALDYADDRDLSRLEPAARVELVIVLAGARRDLGQIDAAVLELQGPARRTKAARPWAVRIWYAYADALLAAGREQEAREWFASAAQVDVDGHTDATERLLELDGVVFEAEGSGDGGSGDGDHGGATDEASRSTADEPAAQVPGEPAQTTRVDRGDSPGASDPGAGAGPANAALAPPPAEQPDATDAAGEQAETPVPAVHFRPPAQDEAVRLFD